MGERFVCKPTGSSAFSREKFPTETRSAKSVNFLLLWSKEPCRPALLRVRESYLGSSPTQEMEWTSGLACASLPLTHAFMKMPPF
ncbi:hypothetical protein GE061_000367 [Apolygus lucorum]|uniref:Uncharacterized protein n=1 Tax=Apolygus lucorum TaxID=248454 RepID=A0A6A4KAD3_APOLU|nr:hypothetical protein GE061_000367 [Apolygus lucorum]